MNEFKSYASVVLDVAVDKILDYGILKEQQPLVSIGSRVSVQVRNKLCEGYVVAIKNSCNLSSVKPISAILFENPLITPDMLQLALWISSYYCAPLRDIFRMLLPPAVRKGMSPKEQLFVIRKKSREEIRAFCSEYRSKKPAQVTILETMLPITKGILLSQLLEETKGSRHAVNNLVKEGFLAVEKICIDRSLLIDEEYFPTKPKKLNHEQAEALSKIQKSLLLHKFETHLLYGVTGSGKTEVYLQAIDQALKEDKATIMLVPEISLTSQTMERFRGRFKEKIAILHHRLSDGERNDAWHNIKAGKAKIVVGARSAIFSPVKNLGLIIVDEEHEQSYKQSDCSPCYQARDVAVMRGKLTDSTVILGSATPSLESYFNATQGKYTLSTLNNRANAALLPHITIVDMQKEYEKAKGITQFSDALLSGIEKRYQKGEQTILFLNRRGYHTVLRCQACQQTIKCLHCDLPMTFHLGDNCLSCHLCYLRHTPPPTVCSYCRAKKTLKFRGAGTEQIERALHAIFPSIRTLRIDADTTRHKGSHQKLLRSFATGKADLLIGTQMIAKGLHFPEVTLVGVLNADAGLSIPDFRASENVFQIITQVAGRAGRGDRQGEVIIQTTIPENTTIQHASRQDFFGFYKEEIAIRELFGYPPFCHIAKLLFSGSQARQTEDIAKKAREQLLQHLSPQYLLHPVVPCGYTKVKDQFRFQFLIRGPSMLPLGQAIKKMEENVSIPRKIKIFIDINPSSTFF